MTASAYRLPDEPLPSGLNRYAVDPMWPLLTLMLGGNAFGLTWFVVNGLALGSPTRAREWTLVALSLLGSAGLVFGLGGMAAAGWLQGSELRYAALSIVTLKLAIAYAIYMMQARCFEIWEHYGGVGRNGLPLLLLIAVVGRGFLATQAWPAWLGAMLR